MKYSDCKTAFVEPRADNMIDLIHPETGKSLIEGEALEQIRQRYPTAEIVNVDDWCAAKGAKQDERVTWKEITEKRYNDMLCCLPPAAWIADYFLVGEPWDHHAVSGRPRYAAFGRIGERYIEASRPMTIPEFKLWAGQ